MMNKETKTETRTMAKHTHQFEGFTNFEGPRCCVTCNKPQCKAGIMQNVNVGSGLNHRMLTKDVRCRGARVDGSDYCKKHTDRFGTKKQKDLGT